MRLTGAEHPLKSPNECIVAVSPAKRGKSGILMGFAEHQKLCTRSAEAACGEYLSLRGCSAPVNLVTQRRAGITLSCAVKATNVVPTSLPLMIVVFRSLLSEALRDRY
jgi:hypothetical protein